MINTPAYCRQSAFEAFCRELPAIDTPRGLLRAAAAIGLHAEPEASVDHVEDVVCRLASSVRRRVRTTSQQAVLAHLHDVLFDLVGFRGAEANDYYDPANSYLHRVLETRRGIPITLALVYRSVAAELDLRVDGVNSPGHFLAAVTCREATGVTRQYVDPFYGGSQLSSAEAVARIEEVTAVPLDPVTNPLAIASPTDWLTRMLMNLQAIFARTQRERDLLAMQELQALVSVV